MKKYSILIVGMLLAALAIISCSSAPPAAEPETPPTDGVAAAPPPVPAPEDEMQKAEALKKDIEDNEFGVALPDEFDKANEELSQAKDAMGNDNASAKALLDSALGRYNAVFEAGAEARCKNLADEIDKAREQADSIKAAKTAEEEYRQGETKAGEFTEHLGGKRYPEAWDAASDAITAFNASYETANAKRGAAESELTKAAGAKDAASKRLQEVNAQSGSGAGTGGKK